MKAIFRVITLFLALSICLPCFAQSNEEITLTVSSDGPTKDDAIKNALRTAIEQAYGAFVSANTTILNDDLVKDEIVTISTGAIKNYAVVSEYEKKDGNGYGVTVNATVSLPHLVKYAQNHGSECEFAGNTFGMQMKLWELQKKNELAALDNMFAKAERLLSSLVQWKMEVKEPRNADDFNFYFDYRVPDVLDSIRKNINKSDYYLIEFVLTCTTHPDYTQEEILRESKESVWSSRYLYTPVARFLKKEMKAISMSEEELKAAESRKENVGGFDRLDEYIVFRNSGKVIDEKWKTFLQNCIKEVLKNIIIEDNTGTISDPHVLEIVDSKDENIDDLYFIKDWSMDRDYIYVLAIDKDNNSLFSQPYYMKVENFNPLMYHKVDYIEPVFYINKDGRWIENAIEESSAKPTTVTLKVLIPKSEIGKYSSFKFVKN